jgi:hypothetical protein
MRIAAVAIGVAALALVSRAGQADLAPSYQDERALQAIVQNAGYSCSKVTSWKKAVGAAAAALAQQGYDEYLINCARDGNYEYSYVIKISRLAASGPVLGNPLLSAEVTQFR